MQIDFLSHLKPQGEQQLSFLDDTNKIHVRKTNEDDICEFFASITDDEIINHSLVWQKLACKNSVDEFKRWLFAFMSVHTTYENNMKGYLAIKDWTEWFNKDPRELKSRIEKAGVGLHNNRTRFISDFAQKFWSDPDFFKYKNGRWSDFRDKLVKAITGLGMAKVSFALEMIDTFNVGVFCGDTHLFQAYGYKQDIHAAKYREIEHHWVGLSKAYNISPAISRAVYWNRKKGEKDCMYWASVFVENDLDKPKTK